MKTSIKEKAPRSWKGDRGAIDSVASAGVLHEGYFSFSFFSSMTSFTGWMKCVLPGPVVRRTACSSASFFLGYSYVATHLFELSKTPQTTRMRTILAARARERGLATLATLGALTLTTFFFF